MHTAIIGFKKSNIFTKIHIFWGKTFLRYFHYQLLIECTDLNSQHEIMMKVLCFLAAFDIQWNLIILEFFSFFFKWDIIVHPGIGKSRVNFKVTRYVLVINFCLPSYYMEEIYFFALIQQKCREKLALLILKDKLSTPENFLLWF